MTGPVVDILMYHSISDGPGPTNIEPEIFAEQIAELAASGVPVVTMDDILRPDTLPPHSVAVTFDDGFQDFADTAWPILKGHAMQPIVYLPASHIGGQDVWEPPDAPRRDLMDRATIRALAAEGVLFGSHTLSHPDLTTLSDDDLADQLTRSQQEIGDVLGAPVHHFAAPYGQAEQREQREIAKLYDTSVSVVLDSAQPASGLHHMPRLEMYYYRDLDLWKRHLSGRGNNFLKRRRLLRRVRKMATMSWK